MRQQVSKVHSSLKARGLAALNITAKDITAQAVNALATMGVILPPSMVYEQVQTLGALGAFDTAVGDSAFTAPITSPTLPTPIQFLQTWLPGFIKVITAARQIDKLIGIDTVGEWEHEEIVATIVEPAAMATEYGDTTNVPLADWNVNFERRNIVRAEQGMAVYLLEEQRAAAMKLSTADQKRQAAALGLEIWRNAVGFYGWNNGRNRTFGFLNDPNLPAFLSNPSGKSWGDATLTEDQVWENMLKDIRAAIVQLRIQSGDNIDPNSAKMCLALPTSKRDYLSVTTKFGISVQAWLEQTYKGLRIESAPELQGWNKAAGLSGKSSDDVFYLYLEEVSSEIDGSTDGGQVFSQMVPTKFITLGVEKKIKSYLEDFGAASAGSLCKRPWAVVRVMGI